MVLQKQTAAPSLRDLARELGISHTTVTQVPPAHGFCCLNDTKNPGLACSGVDQQPRVIGARGIELFIGQIQRGEYGVPEHPMSATIPPV